MTAHPVHGGPRYDPEWDDVRRAELDHDKWAQLRALADQPTDPNLMRRTYRAAAFFPPREEPT